MLMILLEIRNQGPGQDEIDLMKVTLTLTPIEDLETFPPEILEETVKVKALSGDVTFWGHS